jgi:hypothetical protein
MVMEERWYIRFIIMEELAESQGLDFKQGEGWWKN